MQTHGFDYMLALFLFGKILVFQPAVTVAGDFPSRFLHRRNGFGVAGHGGRHAINGGGDAETGEHAPQPPEAGARAIFIDRFHVQVALTRPGLRTDDFRQQRFRRLVIIENAALAALLVIDDELHGDARTARPFRIGNIAAVAHQITGVIFGNHAATQTISPKAETDQGDIKQTSEAR
ncbi:hypothetical protein D3C87_891700 [compost metagenome]